MVDPRNAPDRKAFRDDRPAKVVRTIVEFGHVPDHEVAAEASSGAFLRDNGCDEPQSFLAASPAVRVEP